MGKGKRVGNKRHVKRGIDCKYAGSDDSDEDYTVAEDEECNESDECSSFAGEESEESLFEYEAEIEDEEDGKKRKVNRSRGRCFPVRNVPKKRTSYREEGDGEFNDDDDYNDEEFTPDENDLDEDEEEDEGIAKTKVARPPSRKKPSVKRNKGKKVKSTISKKRMTYNNGKNLPRKNKRSKLTEDSDCSKSSDFEYTISEEEREQLMEASHFCRNSSSNVHHKREQPPKKRLKTKVDDVLKKEEGKQVCGICFSEEGNWRKIRGTLNSCSHYFCFTCIFEWSKVESRCPMCKQRFNSISKPSSKSNSIVIQVPERDQIYQPTEEEILSYLDPYENMICIECHQGGDDAIMLLCDLCDSPSHTFCVGLGREVPEGNWYCEACRPTVVVPDSLMPQTQNPSVVDSRSNEIDLNEAYVPETPLNRVNSYVSSQVTRSRPFTVSERRRIQHRINILVNNRVTALVNRNRFEESVPPYDRLMEVFQPPRGTVGFRSQGQNWNLFSLSSQMGQTSTSANVSLPNAGSDAGISMSGQREEVISSRAIQGDPHTLF